MPHSEDFSQTGSQPTQETLSTAAPREVIIDFQGGWLTVSPKGSSYIDPQSRAEVFRKENSFGVTAKTTQGKKVKLGLTAVKAILKFFETDKGKAYLATLPIVPNLDEL